MSFGTWTIFCGGILMGMLLTFSVVNRIDPSRIIESNGREHMELNVDWEESPPLKELSHKPDVIDSNHANQYLLRPIPVEDNPASAQSHFPVHKSTSSQIADRSVQPVRSTTTSSRWVPGREGTLTRIRGKAMDSAVAVIDVEENNEFNSILANSSTEKIFDAPGEVHAAQYAGKMRSGRREKHGVRSGRPFKTNSSGTGLKEELFYLYDSQGRRYTALEASVQFKEPVLLPYPPLPKYHDQFNSYAPEFAPSLQGATAARNHALIVEVERSKPAPNMTLQKAVFESSNLKLHLCNGQFEAYSAAYLTTREHILAVKSENFNLSYVNCEMASFVHMREHNNFYTNVNGHGMIIQSIDVLDFSVIHLSAFERSSKKYMDKLWRTREERKTQWSRIDAVKEAGVALDALLNPLKTGRQPEWSNEAKRTVVIMPFLGGIMGAGHSELGNRFEYLRACFWSIFEFLPNIVPGVTRQTDVDWCKKDSGLPFFDVLLIENLPKGASLPLATVRHTKAKLQSGEWNFDFVFFTESDQILITRTLPMLFNELKRFPRRMLLPHRLMPYSGRVIKEIHNKVVDSVPNTWMNQSCCLPRQNCVERKTWLNIAHPQVPVINYYGLYVPLGNVNFLDEEYRACKLTDYVNDYCP